MFDCNRFELIQFKSNRFRSKAVEVKDAATQPVRFLNGIIFIQLIYQQVQNRLIQQLEEQLK